jgi:ATP-dependent protease ClpP protease subunit
LMTRFVQAVRQIAEMRLRADDKVGDIVRIFGGLGGDNPVKGDAAALAITAADQRKSLAILIDSPGGMVKDARRIVDAIENRKGSTWTYALSMCASGAALVFAAGQQRWAESRTIFNLHYTERVDRSELDRMTALELRSAAAALEDLDKWMVGYLHGRTRHPSALLRQMLGEDKLMNTDEAKLMGLVTHRRKPGKSPPAAESMKILQAKPAPPPAPVARPEPRHAARSPATAQRTLPMMRLPTGGWCTGPIGISRDRFAEMFLGGIRFGR